MQSDPKFSLLCIIPLIGLLNCNQKTHKHMTPLELKMLTELLEKAKAHAPNKALSQNIDQTLLELKLTSHLLTR